MGNARKDNDGKLLLNMGYAFVTTRKPEMAQELIQKKRMKLEDGSDIEFKPINRNKRLVANQNCKEKNISKINDVNGRNGMRNGNNNNNLGALVIGEVRFNLRLKSNERIYLVIFLMLLLQIKKMIASMMPFSGHLNIIEAIRRFLISRFLKCVNMKMLKKTHFPENHFALLDPKEALDDFFSNKSSFHVNT